MRFDLSSLGVFVAALCASLSAAFWIHRLDQPGTAQAAPAVVAAAPVARGSDTQIVKGPDGHYWAEARIDGRAVRVLVDTGASVVALTRDDAARLGLSPKSEDFTARVETASGPVRAAPVTLSVVAVAGAEVRQVQALIVEEGLPYSLLGMSYLGKLSSMEATPSGLTLRP
ncbi:hypothetical protein ASG17_04810 [Brevundimonas sp. Leaf363]|uniref:retropepsin-like aspartic protease family protein n=1 Tax=Brevundimonas sp. Leaf363 TaxID=1736353 RepID=UPI0006FFDA97|nr:TIGR02281 family clan AA aspartic protease [Brevundimonas sp. Leaf363]KQS55409.1 hypothetical protein ASG17_04810 [Brevundimonas sp. Leaf363]